MVTVVEVEHRLAASVGEQAFATADRDRAPADVRHLQAASARKRDDLTGHETEPFVETVLRGALRQELHAETDAEDGLLTRQHLLAQHGSEVALRDAVHRFAECAYTRKNQRGGLFEVL